MYQSTNCLIAVGLFLALGIAVGVGIARGIIIIAVCHRRLRVALLRKFTPDLLLLLSLVHLKKVKTKSIKQNKKKTYKTENEDLLICMFASVGLVLIMWRHILVRQPFEKKIAMLFVRFRPALAQLPAPLSDGLQE